MANILEIDFFLEKIKEKERIHHLVKSKEKDDEGRSLLAISNAIDHFFIFYKLRNYCKIQSYSKSFATDVNSYEIEFLSAIETWLVENLSPPLGIQAYSLIKELLENNYDLNANRGIIKKIEGILNAEQFNLHESHKVEIYSFLTTFCVKKINLGKTQYLSVLFSLYNEMINIEFHSGFETMPTSVYSNMINIAIKLKDHELFKSIYSKGLIGDGGKMGFSDGIEWASKFAKFYYSRLEEKNRDSFYNYCLALIEFENENFHEANRILNRKTHIQGRFINLNWKSLHLKVLFELEYFDTTKNRSYYDDLEKLLENYRKQLNYESRYLNRLGYTLDIFKAFETIFKRLNNLYKKYYGRYLKGEKQFLKKKGQLIEDVNKISFLFKPWFLEKLKAIK